MSELDLINSLGLGTTDEAAATDTAPADATTEVEAATAPAKRTEIKITGTITKSTGLLPARAPSGGGFGEKESKYPFKDLAAPTFGEDGAVTGYDYFEVKLSDVENADAKKLQGAVQAAVAAQNKKHKEANESIKYVSRTIIEDGAYVGSSVYRVDATLEGE